MLAFSGSPNPNGRDRLDDHEDLVAANDGRGGQGVRQTQVGSQSGRTATSISYAFSTPKAPKSDKIEMKI